MARPRLSQVRPEGIAGQYPKVNATADGWTYDVPAGGSGSTDDFVVTPEDHGAVGDGSTDDTAAIQAAIDAVIDNGSGVVQFSAKTYVVAGALSTANTGYAQITFKACPLADETYRTRTVRLEGPPDKNAIIKSTLTGQTYSGTFGIPSVIGGPTRERVAAGTMRNLAIRARNVNVVVPDNPTVSGWNLEQIAHVSLEECDVWPVGNQGITVGGTVQQPTHTWAVGVILPGFANYEQHWLRNVHITGFYIGIHGGEHAVIDGATIYRCIVAWAPTLHQHLQAARQLSVSWCPYVIASANPRVGLYSTVSGGGSYADGTLAAFAVDELDIEDSVDTDWSVKVDHIYDPGNLFHGVVRGIHVLPTSGATADSANFTVSGGSHLNIINDANTATSASGITVQDENGTVASSVTQIDFQGGGVVATAGTGEVVVTVAASTGELLMTNGVSNPPVPLTTEDGTDWLYQG